MLGKKLSIKDLEAVDTEFYNSLVWMKYVSCQSLCLILCLGAHAPKAYGSRFVYVCIYESIELNPDHCSCTCGPMQPNSIQLKL